MTDKNIITIDIETIPDQRPDAFERYVSEVTPPANYKKPETIDKWMAENAEKVAEEQYVKTALNGLHGEICNIAFAVGMGDITSVGYETEGNERDILRVFWEQLMEAIRANNRPGEWKNIEWVGHNLLEFDLRILHQRSIVNDYSPVLTIPVDERHGYGRVFDTMKGWAGWRGYVKLDELVDAFGIGLPDWPELEDAAAMDGSEVWSKFQAEDFRLIALYNSLDVWKTREVYRRMTFVS